MDRNYPDWISAYLDYTEPMEAPKHMRFWCAISAIGGALRRKVWIDQAYFKWYPNFYIILVAPPGVVSKSTTTGVAMEILREIPGVRFGPDVVTWQSLVTTFAESKETFEWPPGVHNIMSPLTLESSEFGNLLDPQNREQVDLFVSLWDGKQGAFTKETKMSGKDVVENPWINMIACTTPAWIAGSFPEYMIGGGFTSRCIFVYAEEKAKEVAYPIRVARKDRTAIKAKLIYDLARIGKLCGEYRLTEDAYEWGTAWYHHHNTNKPPHLNDERFGGYLARKQTHIHKTAMALAASRSDSLWIDAEILALANQMVTDLEPDMAQVFSRIGRTQESANVERFLTYIRTMKKVKFEVAFAHVHKYFPGLRNFEDILAGLLRAKLIAMVQDSEGTFLVPLHNGKPV